MTSGGRRHPNWGIAEGRTSTKGRKQRNVCAQSGSEELQKKTQRLQNEYPLTENDQAARDRTMKKAVPPRIQEKFH